MLEGLSLYEQISRWKRTARLKREEEVKRLGLKDVSKFKINLNKKAVKEEEVEMEKGQINYDK